MNCVPGHNKGINLIAIHVIDLFAPGNVSHAKYFVMALVISQRSCCIDHTVGMILTFSGTLSFIMFENCTILLSVF